MKKKTTQMRGPQKRTIIKKIKEIIREWGSFTTADVQANSSPCISSMKGVTQLAETFKLEGVEAVTYELKHDEEI